MRKLLFLFSLFAVLLCAACKQLATGNDVEKPVTEPVTPGWYLYTTNAGSGQPQLTYLYINSSGAIERAGSSSYEYTGSQLEMMQKQLSYSICKKNADGTVITFAACEAPSWGTVNNESDNNTTCPYAEGEYLDIYKHWEKHPGSWQSTPFYWPVNKNLPLWTERALEYSVTCTREYGYINKSNVFIAGANLKEGDEVKFSVKIKIDEYNTSIYHCYVTFTKSTADSNSNDTGNGGSGITLAAGYEWWCFVGAYLGNGVTDNGRINGYVLYDANGNPVRAGSSKKEETNSLYLSMTREQAIKNFNGTKYKVTDLTQLPSWCY